MDINFGLIVSGWHDSSQPLGRQLDAHIEQAVVASKAGYGSVWVAEHFLAQPRPVFQAIPFLARMVPEVNVSQLGVISVLPFRHPVAFAEELATLDAITGGRLVVCLVMGWRPSEFEMFGISTRDRVGRFTEYLAVMDRLMTSQSAIDYEGRFINLKQVTMIAQSVQRPRIPFWIGAGAVKSVQRAAHIGDNWLGSLHTPFSVLKSLADTYSTERQEMGMPNESVLLRNCYVASTREQAIDEAGPALLRYYQTLDSWGLFSEVLPGQPLATSVENATRDRAIVGSVDDCVRELYRYVDLGFREFIFQVGVPGIRHQHVIESVQRVANEVIPRLRERTR